MITPWRPNSSSPEYYQEIKSEDGHLSIRNDKDECNNVLEIRDLDGDLIVIDFRDQKIARRAAQILMRLKNLC